MTSPDLAALRALLEAVDRSAFPLHDLLPAAQAALGRVENEPQHTKPSRHSDYCAYDQCRISECSHSVLHDSLTEMETRLAQLEKTQTALERVETELLGLQGAYTMAADDNGKLRVRVVRLEAALLTYGKHAPRCPLWATQARGTCACGLDVAMEGRDG